MTIKKTAATRTVKPVAQKTAPKAKREASKLSTISDAINPRKPAAKKVAAKPARAKKPVVRVPRAPRLTQDQRMMLEVQKFEATKLVSGLISTYVRETGAKIVTHVDQPEVKAVLNRDVFVRDAHTQKLIKMGRVQSALVSAAPHHMGSFYIFSVYVDDGAIALHQIRKIGTKFVYDASLPMPNKRQTHLVERFDFDKPRGKKTRSDIDPAAEVKRQQLQETHGYAKGTEIADKATVKMTKVEGELSGTAIAKGTAVVIDSTIRGDVIKMTKIIIEGKGTKRSPFVKRRYIFTEKGQKCPVAELVIVRGKLRAV